MILTEFDSVKKAVINPEDIHKPIEGMPRIAVACYSNTTFERMLDELETEVIATTRTANGIKPIYKTVYKDTEIALFMIDVGAPASVGMLDEVHMRYTVGKVWTTDAFYRETVNKVKSRKEQGCICVDMECSANTAFAAFRGKDLIQFFYAADNLDAEEWDARSLSNHAKIEEKNRIALIALELAVRIQG